MKTLKFKRSKFDLKKFLDALHRFSADGNPLPAVSGDTVYHDNIDLAEDLDEEIEKISDDSLERLEMGLPLFGYFALFDGDTAFDCIDGQEVEVPNLDDEEEEEEPRLPRRRRTKKYLEAIKNTPCDECTCYGYLIWLNGETVEIEPKAMRDIDGDCELEIMLEPNLLGDAMRRWVKSFLIPKKRGKS